MGTKCIIGLSVFCLQFLMLLSTDEQVDGWEKGKSRSVADYVLPSKNTILYSGESACPKTASPTLLIVVCSAVQNFKRRQAVRETWGSKSSYRNKIIFFIGLSKHRGLNEQVIAENNIYNDIVTDDCIDTYNNLTVKTLRMMKWVLNACSHVKYLLKVDDDLYVNMRSLKKFLKTLKTEYTRSDYLIGFVQLNALVYRNHRSKWFVPEYMFANEMFPRFLSGVAYMMSIVTAKRLYNSCFTSELIYLEDVYVTGICAGNAGVIPQHNNQFNFSREYRPFECKKPFVNLIPFAHHIDIRDYYVIHYEVLKCILASKHHRKQQKTKR